MEIIEQLLKYIQLLKGQSFIGWTEEEKKGYLTALGSMEIKISELKK